MQTRETLPFTSEQSKWERILALAWLPVHLFLLPMLAVWLFSDRMNQAELNLVVYGTGVVYMLLTQWRFLRRDFDPLCDRPLRVLLEVLISYGLMLLMNLALNGLLMFLLPEENPNNSSIMDMAGMDYGMVSALAIFLAPIVEELMFRAGIFGLIRKRSRWAAYAVSMLLFALYHVWAYALESPVYLLYILQYLPISYLLCRCYERTDSIWSSIFLHMLVNAVSIRALQILEELL